MVYHWKPHKDELYELYIQERKSLEEIMQYMEKKYAFAPSKRAFQTQFKRWDFPSKQNPAHKNPDIVARVKELWEQNYSQRQMLNILNQEGFGINERDLLRVRGRNRWLLRVRNGKKLRDKQIDPILQSVNNTSSMMDDQSTMYPAPGTTARAQTFAANVVPTPPLVETLKKRKERLDQMKTESDERWAAKKRRRRTRGYAGLAPDPPGPPRFPSETTLDESKQFLSLSADTYRQVREQFQSICEENGVMKKTLAGPDKWQAVKERLVQENPDLQVVFQIPNQLDAKQLALDVICTDVTKRMRTAGNEMTITDAKNALGVNPEQARQIRNAFYVILEADHFTSKLEAGPEHWDELKREWIENTPLLQEVLSQSQSDEATKQKAMEILCRDVMKRLRNSQVKAGVVTRNKVNPPNVRDLEQQSNSYRNTGNIQHYASANSSSMDVPMNYNDIGDLQLDPSLLQAVEGFLPLPDMSQKPPVAVYVRPHPGSEIHRTTKMWLGTLSTSTIAEMYGMLGSKWPDANVIRIDGIEKGPQGQEISYLIEEDEELEAYLDHVSGRKAVFTVLLSRA